MALRLLYVAVVLLGLAVTLSDSLPTTESAQMVQSGVSDDDVRKLVLAYNHFGLKLYNHLKNRKANILFSPMAAASAASMFRMGTRTETVKGADQSFMYPDVDDDLDKAYSRLKNSVDEWPLYFYNIVVTGQFVPHPVLDSYLEALGSVYPLFDISRQNFIDSVEASKKEILDLVGENQMTKPLLEDPMINRLTSLVLLSVSNYVNKWGDTLYFDDNDTKVEEFHNYNGTLAKVEMIYTFNRHLNYTYSTSLESHVVELPLKAANASMYVILPKDGAHGFDALEEKLTPELIEEAIHDLKPSAVEVKLPKLREISSTYKEWSKGIQETSVSRNAPLDADVSSQRITGYGDLALTGIGHGGYLSISEDRVKFRALSIFAAETTDDIPGITSDHVKQVFCTHPFLYLTREKTSGLIFQMGSLRNIN